MLESLAVPQKASQDPASRGENPTQDKRKEEEETEEALKTSFRQMRVSPQHEDKDKLGEEDNGEQDTPPPLPPTSSFSHLRLTPQSFEKDDDDNFHIDFITAASNLRATNYDITPVDRAESKRIAGRIVPAIVTSTAVAAGLAALEMLKVTQGHRNTEVYRTTEFSLAMCRFFMGVPAPPEDTVSAFVQVSPSTTRQMKGKL